MWVASLSTNQLRNNESRGSEYLGGKTEMGSNNYTYNAATSNSLQREWALAQTWTVNYLPLRERLEEALRAKCNHRHEYMSLCLIKHRHDDVRA
jgi:hypothetical protein